MKTIIPVISKFDVNLILTINNMDIPIDSTSGVYPISFKNTTGVYVSGTMEFKPSTNIRTHLHNNYPDSNITTILFDFPTMSGADTMNISVTIKNAKTLISNAYTVVISSGVSIMPIIVDYSITDKTTVRKVKNIVMVDTSTATKSNLTISRFVDYVFVENSIYTTEFTQTCNIPLLTDGVYKITVNTDTELITKYIVSYNHTYDMLVKYVASINPNQLKTFFEKSEYSVILHKFLYLLQLDTYLDTLLETDLLNKLVTVSDMVSDLDSYLSTLSVENSTASAITVQPSSNKIQPFNLR